ncbi:MAG: putative porin [Bdellovibrionales bacterium]
MYEIWATINFLTSMASAQTSDLSEDPQPVLAENLPLNHSEQNLLKEAQPIFNKKVIDSWTVDFRYRHQTQDDESVSPYYDISNKIQARIGFFVQPDSNIGLGFRLATGDGSPVSHFNPLEPMASWGKSFNIDRAYLVWEPRTSIKVSLGKFENVLYRPGESATSMGS